METEFTLSEDEKVTQEELAVLSSSLKQKIAEGLESGDSPLCGEIEGITAAFDALFGPEDTITISIDIVGPGEHDAKLSTINGLRSDEALRITRDQSEKWRRSDERRRDITVNLICRCYNCNSTATLKPQPIAT